jgi:two-component system capsular synthesis response regulator RcsB
MVKIIVADDYAVVRVGVRAILEKESSAWEIVDEVGKGNELMESLARNPCDLLITDFPMLPDGKYMDGIVLTKKIRELYPELSIVVLTTLESYPIFASLYAVGVSAVVKKSSPAEELINAVETVLEGRVFIDKDVVKSLTKANDLAADDGARGEDARVTISQKEVEVIQMLMEGLTVSEIARRTGHSVKTISQQKRDAMRKLGVTSDYGLYEYALINGLWR